MDIAKLQTQSYLEGRRRYKELTGVDPDAPVCVGTADTTASTSSAGAKLHKVIDQLRRTHPGAFEPRLKLPKGEPGPVMREALQLAEALRRAAQGDVAEASSGLEGKARSLESPRDGYFRVILPMGGE